MVRPVGVVRFAVSGALHCRIGYVLSAALLQFKALYLSKIEDGFWGDQLDVILLS